MEDADTSLISLIAIGAPVTFTTYQRKIFIPLIEKIDLIGKIFPFIWSYPFNYIVDFEPVVTLL